ncbi:MAG TPA: hypothetical protein VGP62_19450 [Bryobacteraceae bacterium]|nr:hypothetical protein [Bryobacteraceae bacterium]
MPPDARPQFAAVLAFVIFPVCTAAQTEPSKHAVSDGAVMAQLVALRDSFVSQIKAAGFQPGLPPPEIIPDDQPSFGAYDPRKNVVHVAVWDALRPEQQAGFAGFFGQGQKGEQAFDETVYHWVFTHELGHWWQECRHKAVESHYSLEIDASRIAAAYWRWKDSAFMEVTAKRIAAVSESTQGLVPADQHSEKYFDENYLKLGLTPASFGSSATWFLKLLPSSRCLLFDRL